MSFTRRQFLFAAAGSGLALGLGRIPLIARGIPGSMGDAISDAGGATPSIASSGTPAAAGAASAAGNPLRFPPLHTGDKLVAQAGIETIWPETRTEIWVYGESYPAPTIVLQSGATFSTRLENRLAEPTNIHWHGLVIPAAMDGHPRDVTEPGGQFDYTFTVNQRAGTYWYHPHPHMATGKQVYKGMAGFFIVHDPEEESLGLPSGEFDLPLLVQDRRLESDNSFKYEVEGSDHIDGYIGDVALVNGTPDAYLQVKRGLYRLRLLNGSNARIYDLALDGNAPFHVIGTDGGLLDKPYEVTYAFLAPGERLEILIDFSRYQDGQSVVLGSLPFSGDTGRKQGSAMQLLRFDVSGEGNGLAIPSKLATVEKLDPAQAARTRVFELKIDHGTTPETHTINDRLFDMMRIDEQVKLGDMEIWTFKNISFLHHPMHLHGSQFQVLDRNGNANLPPTDLGWKDTVYVRPYQTLRVLVRFNTNPGVYLVHCHNLEHEDHGMMLNYEMVAELGVEGAEEMPLRMELR